MVTSHCGKNRPMLRTKTQILLIPNLGDKEDITTSPGLQTLFVKREAWTYSRLRSFPALNFWDLKSKVNGYQSYKG